MRDFSAADDRWGQNDKTPCEHNESGYPSIADMRADLDRRGFVPVSDIGRAYSITSSARASSVAGTARPIAFAVVRLIASSYLVGVCTGNPAGFSPFRMRSR